MFVNFKFFLNMFVFVYFGILIIWKKRFNKKIVKYFIILRNFMKIIDFKKYFFLLKK